MKTTVSLIKASIGHLLLPPTFILIALACVTLLPKAQAVVPPPDGGYANFNTAEGQNALFSLTTGAANTAVGWFSLFTNTDGSFNTATGAGALLFNTADANTALGAAALLFNTSGTDNTATGAAALVNNTTGTFNTATGVNALFSNTTGSLNTAVGTDALPNNTTGERNTAQGGGALFANTEGHNNSALGSFSLARNTTGNNNTATGVSALERNTTGGNNTAIGFQALSANTNHENTAVGSFALSTNTSGFSNTAIGERAGENITGNGNVCIGEGIAGEVGVNDRTYIRNVFNTGQANNLAVTIGANGLLGTQGLSARRFKEDVKTMDKTSEALFALRPVTFRYKKEVDADHSPHCGLIAEEVEKINPDLVTRDENGHLLTVRYDSINAMLLNEFLKEHHRVQKLEAALEAITARLNKQESELQKVGARVEVSEKLRGRLQVRIESKKTASKKSEIPPDLRIKLRLGGRLLSE